MAHTFTDALAIVLKGEGGFVNDSRDPGGMTNLGVTARTWQAWTGRPVTEKIMRGLSRDVVAPMYRAWYWDKVGGNDIPPALALAMLDFAVNAGVGRTLMTLQGIVGAPVDGVIGPATLGAIRNYAARIGLGKLVARICDARRDFYRSRDLFPIFGKGWLARVDRIQMEALTWMP